MLDFMEYMQITTSHLDQMGGFSDAASDLLEICLQIEATHYEHAIDIDIAHSWWSKRVLFFSREGERKQNPT